MCWMPGCCGEPWPSGADLLMGRMNNEQEGEENIHAQPVYGGNHSERGGPEGRAAVQMARGAGCGCEAMSPLGVWESSLGRRRNCTTWRQGCRAESRRGQCRHRVRV